MICFNRLEKKMIVTNWNIESMELKILFLFCGIFSQFGTGIHIFVRLKFRELVRNKFIFLYLSLEIKELKIRSQNWMHMVLYQIFLDKMMSYLVELVKLLPITHESSQLGSITTSTFWQVFWCKNDQSINSLHSGYKINNFTRIYTSFYWTIYFPIRI